MHVHEHLIGLAGHVYDNPNRVRLGHGLEVAHYGANESGVGNVAAIQGSDIDPRDWARNFMAWGAYDRELGYAPWGFHRASKRAADYFCQIYDPAVPFRITGHSAGAAIGILTAQRMQSRGWRVLEMVGFAPPRTGRRELNTDTTLYDHGGDLVCKVPWWWKHPVDLVRLPDQTPLPRQHGWELYALALAEYFEPAAGTA